MTAVKILEFTEASGDRLRTSRVRLFSDGLTYSITLDWLPLADNEAGAWSFAMASNSGTTIAERSVVSGVFLRDRVDVLSGIVGESRPPGSIIVYSGTKRMDPGRQAFEEEGYLLLYLPDGYDPNDFIISEMAG